MRWLNSIIGIGIYPVVKEPVMPVRTLNTLALVVLGTLAAIVFSILHVDLWGLYLSLIGFMFVLGLIGKRRYYVAAVTEVCVTIGSVLSIWSRFANPTWYLCLLPAIVFPFFIFPLNKKMTMLVTSIISLLTYTAEPMGSNGQFPFSRSGWWRHDAFAYLSKRSNELVELLCLKRELLEHLLNNFLPSKIAKILRENEINSMIAEI